MAKRLILIISFLFLLIGYLGVVSAVAPPQVNVNINLGLDISFPHFDIIKQSEDFSFRFHVFNISNGVRLNNNTVNCTFELYNESGKEQFRVESMEFETEDWEVIISGENFTRVGQYNYLVDCSTANFGGFVYYGFKVTPSGVELTTARAVIYSTLFFILIFTLVSTIVGAIALPPSNTKDEEGNIMSISYLKYLRAVCIMFGWMILIAIFFISSNLAFAYLGEELFANILFTLYGICFGITPVIVIVWFVWIFVSIFQDKKIKKLIERGIFQKNNL